MNGSGKFPNDFIEGSVRCPRHGCEGGGRRRREHVYAGARRGVRDPRRPAAGGRTSAVGHRSGASLDRGRARGSDDAPGRLVGEPHADGRARRGARGRRLRDRAAARRRPGRAVPGRDDPAAVRQHRSGDDRSGGVREGPPHGSRGAGAGRGDGPSRCAGRVVRGLHQSDRAGDAGVARRGSPGAGPLQRGDRVPTTVRDAVRRGAGARTARARRPQPPDVGAQGAGGRRRPSAGDPRHGDRRGRRRDGHARGPDPGHRRDPLATTCTTTTSRSASWSSSGRAGRARRRLWRSRRG